MKKNNTISLSVHKNTLEQKRRKIARQKMIEASKYLKSTKCTSGFFFISWDENLTYQTQFYDPRGHVGKSVLPYFLSGCAARLVGDIDAEDREK